ncbi:DNA cytosine methyltransferase [Paracoccus versutus]|uniref:DNA (cytosine-5-)-methyltransferase n=2 Tax=Paracoccus versutus TaxID=34007 RepID=A0A3D9XCJ4_PARVE|nr:DNA cytosine methyltransferase [Paracoccus sp. FO-3]REF68305.1 DNA (cytosine-5)-methyltransferase 1 [Paracoccus versutus]WGR58968.1 DNA cytosine methyltransferase [Paracoccus versutus]SFY25069.1 DNA (cytosine-5)-methyltransferase 1 [Paracoccus pantotrophus]
MSARRTHLSLPLRVLDLFSGAAGGWSLGLHRAGFVTIAACEIVEWRRILYSENFPHVRLYADVRDLTAARLVSDLGCLPEIIVGSPPCQDISSANTKGKGIEGERSGLYLEAVRLVGECRPRWFAFENSANLRTRGADRLLDELEALGYACWPCVVGAADIGANHVRKRSWLIGCDPEQLAHARVAIPAGWHADGRRIGGAEGDEGLGSLRPVPQPSAADADGFGRDEGRGRRRRGIDISAADDLRHAKEVGCGPGRSGRCSEPASGPRQPPCGDAACPRDPAHPDEAGPPHGRLEPGLRPPQIADDGRGDGQSDGWCDDGPGAGQMGRGTGAGGDLAEPWPDWNGGIAHHLRLDAGLSAWMARTRIALGSRRGTSAASLIVEAFGDAVVPQIPEAIGRAILRTEAALNAVLGGASPYDMPANDSPSTSTVAGDAATDGDATGSATTDDPADHGGAS